MHHRRLVIPPLALLAWFAVLAPATALSQSIVITLQAHGDAVVSDIHRFGVHDDALMGPDGYDLPEPPPPPGGYLGLSFVMPDAPEVLPNRWRHELRPSEIFMDQTETWELVLETDQVNRPLLLDFAAEIGAQYPLAVTILAPPERAYRVELPAQLPFVALAPVTTLLLELTSDDPVAADTAAWGEIKKLYDR
ncbi:MAG: hypothetical protein Q7W56_00390 [Candidatus Latescibacteria bacterium]|nr:hypothetical protein [Candidatus Latescibacterota bacterium]